MENPPVHGETGTAEPSQRLLSTHYISYLSSDVAPCAGYAWPAWSMLPENLADTANIAVIIKRRNLCGRSGCFTRNAPHHPHWEDFFHLYSLSLSYLEGDGGGEIPRLNHSDAGISTLFLHTVTYFSKVTFTHFQEVSNPAGWSLFSCWNCSRLCLLPRISKLQVLHKG